MLRRIGVILTLVITSSPVLYAQGPNWQPLDINGNIAGDNTYKNPALLMTLVLPGKWQFVERSKPPEDAASDDKKPSSAVCQGPLCGSPDINVAMESAATNSAPFYLLSMVGYKLDPQYLDRVRYPLRKFAEAMTTASLNGSGWIPAGDLNSIMLDGRPAYRLAVTGTPPKTGFGYVSESNGYVFLLVTAANSDPDTLQLAVEAMKLENSTIPRVQVPQSRPMRVRIGSIAVARSLVSRAEPELPEDLKNDPTAFGTVTLHAVIGRDGTVAELSYSSGPEKLASAAIAAVRQWKYNPTTINGRPVEVDTLIDVVFPPPGQK